MTIVLPKDPKKLKGFRFPPAVPFEMNTLNLETIWPQLFRLIILEGRDSSRGSIEQANIESSVTALCRQPRLQGFDGSDGQLALDGIVRASLIRSVRNQKSRKPQIDGLIPYSIASFKAGFPTNQAGFRQLDRFLYELLLESWSRNPTTLRNRFIAVFGGGVNVTGYPSPAVQRAPGIQAELDVISELSISYADVFDTIVPKRTPQPYELSCTLRGFQARLGNDLKRFVETYHSRLTVSLMIEQMTTLLGFELLVFCLKLFTMLPKLVARPETFSNALPDASDDIVVPELFADMTSEPKSLARAMSAACIQRDHLQLDPFIRALLRLRYTEFVVERIAQAEPPAELRELIEQPPTTFDYLQMLAQLPVASKTSAHFAMAAVHDVMQIKHTNRATDDPEDEQRESEVDKLLKEFKAKNMPVIDQMTELLAIPQLAKVSDNIGKWLRAIGGVGKPWGLISGQSDRRSWCYAPGNDLLMVLVQLCAIDRPDWENNPRPQRFGLKHFLDWLERRFGILVDRPPADLGFDSPEHMAAARENLQAMLRRLRQMGIFEDRSDDFSVQKLTPPFMDLA